MHQPACRSRDDGNWLTMVRLLLGGCVFTVLIAVVFRPGGDSDLAATKAAASPVARSEPRRLSSGGAWPRKAVTSETDVSRTLASGAKQRGSVVSEPDAAPALEVAPEATAAFSGQRGVLTGPDPVTSGRQLDGQSALDVATTAPEGYPPERTGDPREASSDTPTASSSPIPPVSAESAKEWGIEVASLRLTAGGSALDFRYRIIDPEKAARVGSEGGPSYLLDGEGRRISPRNVQQIGDYYSARHLDQPGRIYSTWFANQGGALESGDLVSVVIGDLRIPDVRVE